MTTPVQTDDIKNRVRVLLESVLEESNIPKHYHPVINGMVTNFLKKATPGDIRKIVHNIQTEILPYLLGENE